MDVCPHGAHVFYVFHGEKAELTVGAVGMDVAFHAVVGHKRHLRLIDFLFTLAGTCGYGNDAHDVFSRLAVFVYDVACDRSAFRPDR